MNKKLKIALTLVGLVVVYRAVLSKNKKFSSVSIDDNSIKLKVYKFLQ